jgi:hypothetical protein
MAGKIKSGRNPDPSQKPGRIGHPRQTLWKSWATRPSGGAFPRDARFADSVLDRLLLYSCSFDDDLWVLHLIPDVDGVFEALILFW